MRGAVCSHSTAKLCSIPLYSPSLRVRGADANITNFTQTFCFRINQFRFIENLRLSLDESEPQTTLHVLTDSLVFTSCRFNLALQYLCHFSVLIFARPSIRHWLDPAGDGGLGELPPTGCHRLGGSWGIPVCAASPGPGSQGRSLPPGVPWRHIPNALHPPSPPIWTD